jgi:hypothetical protein
MSAGKNTKQQTEARTDVGYEASKFALNVGMGIAVLIGVWGVACLIGGLAVNGPAGLLKGLWIAIAG